MKYSRVIVGKYGGPEVLEVIREACPQPKPGEVLVRVLTAGVSMPDCLARAGMHPETPPVPFTPGWDLVGVVEQAGLGVSGFEPGQVVTALPIHGRMPSSFAGVDAVFDPLGGSHLWQSRRALRPGGKVVGYGLITALRGEGLTANHSGRRRRFRGSAAFGLYIAGGWLLPGRKRVLPYSIQTLKRLKPAWFREDFLTLLELLRQKRIRPLVALRLPLAEARRAHEILEKGGISGKIVLVCS